MRAHNESSNDPSEYRVVNTLHTIHSTGANQHRATI